MIASNRTSKWRVHDSIESTVPVVAERCEFAALAAGDQQVIVTVAIQITPGYAGSKLAQPFRQQWLSSEIVEVVFMVTVRNEVTYVLEQGSRLVFWFSVPGS